MQVRVTICLIPLRYEKVLFLTRAEEQDEVKSFMTSRLGIPENRVNKLVQEVGEGVNLTDIWVKGMRQIDRILKGLQKSGEKDTSPAFSEVVSSERVIQYLSARIKLDIIKGQNTISGGSHPLPNESIEYFSHFPLPNYDMSDIKSLSLVEARMALEMGMKYVQSENPESEIRKAGVLTTIDLAVKEVFQKLDSKGIIQQKCQICQESFHEELTCTRYNSDKVCLKCGYSAKKFCYGGLRRDRKCANEENWDCEACPDIPVHAKSLHFVDTPEQKLAVQDRYGNDFLFKSQKNK